MTLRRIGGSSRALLLGILLLPPAAHSQRVGAITGTVRAANRGPALEGARVVLLGTTLMVSTSSSGEFAFHGLTPGKYVIQASAIGYTTLSSPVEVKALETLEIDFEPEPESAKLPELEVSGKPNLPAEFLRRLSSGNGRYYTRPEIEKRNPPTVGDLLRIVPGVRVDCRGAYCRIQMARAPRNCQPAYFMDGIPVDPTAVLMQPPRDLDGVEVYSGPSETPPELERMAACGAIAVWTRTPPPRVPKEKKDKKKPAVADSVRPPPPKADTTRA